jgi:hypothetical protein
MRMKAISLMLTLITLQACGNPLPGPFDWKEEILLHDGRKVIAERVDTYGGPREPSQKEPNTKDRTIRFADPSDPKKTYTHTITGSSNYLMLDFYEGKPWLVVDVGPFSTDTRCPIGTYDTYSWDGQQWVQRSFKDRPRAFIKPNMAVVYTADNPDRRKKGETLSAQSIVELQRDIGRLGVVEVSQFVDKRSNGRPSDCHDYRKN